MKLKEKTNKIKNDTNICFDDKNQGYHNTVLHLQVPDQVITEPSQILPVLENNDSKKQLSNQKASEISIKMCAQVQYCSRIAPDIRIIRAKKHHVPETDLS